jgi:hypothetical protein
MKLKELLNPLLTEMPKLIRPIPTTRFTTEFNNKREYIEIEQNNNKSIYSKLNKDIVIYQNNNIFIGVNHTNKSVIYYMEYETSTNNVLGKYAWQSYVWRDPDTIEIKDLATSIFFDYLLSKYGCVTSDEVQSDKGALFWQKCIRDAFLKNINVYYFNSKTEELFLIKDGTEFKEASKIYDIWGDFPSHESKLMIISNRNLQN